MHPLVNEDKRGTSGEPDPSRRDALIRLATLAMSSSLFSKWSFAQQPAADSRIDLHHHFFSPLAKKLYSAPAIQDYSPVKSLEAMDRASIRSAFLSFP